MMLRTSSPSGTAAMVAGRVSRTGAVVGSVPGPQAGVLWRRRRRRRPDRSAASVPPAHDENRAMGMLHALAGHRAHEEPHEPSVSPRADDEHAGLPAGLDE